MTDYVLIRTTVFPAVTEARLYQETIEKILAGHPEVPILLPSLQHATHSALCNPTYIQVSYNNSYVYVDEDSTDHGGQPLHVAVRVVEGTSARVKTVLFASETSSQKIVWRKA